MSQQLRRENNVEKYNQQGVISMKDKWRLEFGDDIEDPAARDRAKINAFRNGCPIILAIFMDEHGWKRKKLRDCLFPPVDMYFKSILS